MNIFRDRLIEKNVAFRTTKIDGKNVDWFNGKIMRTVAAWYEDENGETVVIGPFTRIFYAEEAENEERLPATILRDHFART